jgi:XTP/dITP diphosphohydrolase
VPAPARTIILATRSAGKLRELRPLFAEHGFSTIDLNEAGIAETPDEDELECFATFEDNALAKARHFFRRAGVPTVADDSGLAVDALGGSPGVHSKRWSGRADLTGQDLDDENNALLLRALEGKGNRSARYVCAAAYVFGERELVRRGEVAGAIARSPRGTGGFGYDPFFAADELGGRTFAEVSRDEKARISHRARAMRALIGELERG